MVKHSLNAKLPEQLALRLEKAMLAGKHGPGERLPPERSWAEQLGVSRAVLREALGTLAERGLVQRRQGAGTYVSERPDERRADPWTQMLQRQPLLQTDLLEFREMLEIRCAELAARRADATDISRLTQCHAAVDAAYQGSDRQAQVHADVAFHRAIAQAAHNPVFSHLVSTLLGLLHEHVLISIAKLEPESVDSRKLRVQHSSLLKHIAAHDAPAAARAARAHIAFVRQSWQRRLAGTG
jgi:GntR family transcriptional repressor for pyruvate dehydrogenase complex